MVGFALGQPRDFFIDNHPALCYTAIEKFRGASVPDILWFDVETTGLNAFPVYDAKGKRTQHNIISIAYAVEKDGEVLLERDLSFQPWDYTNVSPEALQVQGITLDDVRSREMASLEALKIVHTDITPYKKLICGGYNVEFDVGFLVAWFGRQGLPGVYFRDLFVGMPKLDAMHAGMATLHRKGVTLEKYNLSSVYQALTGVSLEGAHNALVDIRATRELYYKCWEA